MTAIPRETPVPVSAGTNADGLAEDARRERWQMFGLCSPALLLVGLVVFIPVGWLFWLSFFDAQGALTSVRATTTAGATHEVDWNGEVGTTLTAGLAQTTSAVAWF